MYLMEVQVRVSWSCLYIEKVNCIHIGFRCPYFHLYRVAIKHHHNITYISFYKRLSKSLVNKHARSSALNKGSKKDQ